MLEIRHLKTLHALREADSLVEAAERLHLTQSALSHQLRGLEAEFGVNILDRERGSQLRLSPAGEELLAAAREVLPRVRQLQEELKRRALGNSGRLRIAVECHTCFDWLTPAMDRFRENWPDVEMDLVSGFQQDPLPLLQSHQADLTVLTAPDAMAADIVLHPLFAYEVVALVNPRHALASKPYLEPADFLEETLITYPVEDRRLDLFREFLQPAGIQPWRRRHAELTVIILQLVASGQGIAALPSWAVGSYGEKGYVRALPLGSQGLWQTLQAATTAEQSEQEHMRAFLDEIRASVAANLLGVKDIQGV